MAVEMLQIWYKNTPYRGGLNGLSNKNPTKSNGIGMSTSCFWKNGIFFCVFDSWFRKLLRFSSLLKYRFTTYKISERNVKPKWEKEYSFVLGGNLKGA